MQRQFGRLLYSMQLGAAETSLDFACKGRMGNPNRPVRVVDVMNWGEKWLVIQDISNTTQSDALVG
jgi:hypothetical protein